MSVVALILLPYMLAYQAWTYYVFRRRVNTSDFQPTPQPSRSPDSRHAMVSPGATPPSNPGKA